MTEGVLNLRNEFRQTFGCLGHLQLRLEQQIDDGDYPSSINPIKLHQKVKNLRKVLMNLQKRANAVAEKKQTAIPNLINQLTQNAITIHHLRCKSGLKHTGIPENILSEFYEEIVRHDPNNNGDINVSMLQTNMSHNSQNQMDADEANGDLTEEDFNRLPSSTRQRVTFAQLNGAYSLIKEMYWSQGKKQRKPIAIKVLANKGIKLTGQTGTAILNCLRSLHLIETTKQGVSCL